MMKILIVDDDSAGLYMLETMLKGYGHEVVAAKNGQIALELARVNPPDLIISDILMPVMDGYKLCQEWKKDIRLKNIPFVFYTATYTDPMDKEYALNLGVDSFVLKPIEPKKFLEIIDEVVRACKAGKYASAGQLMIDETAILKGHYERMAKKLEEKVVELEKANIDLKRLGKSLRRSQRELAIRNRISHIFLTIPDEEMYEKVLQVIIEVMESEHGVFAYIDEHENFVCPSMSGKILDKFRIPGEDIVFPCEKWRDIWGRAIIEKKSICSNKPFNVPEGHIPVVRAMDMPIIHKGELVGNLLVGNKATDYDKNDRELLEIIARHIAPVLNARLQRDKKEKEHKHDEETIKKLSRRNELILKSAGEGIFGLDLQMNITFINPAAAKMSGWDVEELVGRSMHTIFHHSRPDGTFYPVEECLACAAVLDWTVHHVYDEIYWRKDGTSFPVEYVSTPIIEKGKLTGAVVTFNDVTKRQDAEKEKKKLERQLAQSQKMEAIGILAGGIAHDFNNILTAVIGYAELANFQIPEGHKARENLMKVLKAGDRAVGLVNQILTFSRQSKLERMPVQIALIIKESIKLLRASLPTTIEIRQNIKAESGIVEADPTQIQQIMMNLFINASHAMNEKGGILEVDLSEIELDFREASKHPDLSPGKYIRLKVSDTGCGMDKEVMERIFDPYFTTKEKGRGTGLGLSVVHGIVKSYGGAITVYSRPGKGSTFNVYIPAVQKEAVEEKDETKPLSTGHERILFVDDEITIVDIVRQMLEHLGYEVDMRTSSIEALELFKSQPDRFDLVITDMIMPNMTGDRLALELMKINPKIPIILCTGFSEKITEEKAKKMGIKAFVMKPLVMANLAETVRKALGGPF